MSALSIAMYLLGLLSVASGFSQDNKLIMAGGVVVIIIGILVSEADSEE